MQYITGVLFLIAFIIFGYRLYKTSRYHVFYFLLCALFLLSFVLLIYAVNTSENYLTSGAYTNPTPGGNFSYYLMGFARVIFMGSFILLLPLSIRNLFAGNNKASVIIVSSFMIALCFFALVLFVIYPGIILSDLYS
jgi:hypothetical protein